MVTLPIESDVAKLELVKQADVLRNEPQAAQDPEKRAAIEKADQYRRELETRYEKDIASLDRDESFKKDPMALGIQQADDDRVATAALSVTLGGIGAALMAIAIMISTFGCNNGLILAGARVFYTMARDGLFFKATGKLNSKHVPAVSLMLQCVWSCFLVLPRTRLYDESGELQRGDDGALLYGNLYGNLLDYVVAAILVFFILVIVGVFVLRRKRPDAERPYKTFGYPVLPALYIIAAICDSGCADPLQDPDYVAGITDRVVGSTGVFDLAEKSGVDSSDCGLRIADLFLDFGFGDLVG